ncbi:protein tipE [Thrips palmi]|uniref:Protein tipE n=1 Tax=Thrips palmi TaxID=161013 RepID=A0A6P9A6Z3_THRPL|nr:protein tipE [Thrips palmi]
MRSSSSELLLDQQAELRKKKLLELAKPRRPVKVKRTWRQRVWFYATAVLALTAMSAGSSLLFLVPLYVDPAISTLTHHFVDVPVTCVTTRREDLTGIFNCTWSSCREGCTSDMYKCTHIYVSPPPPTPPEESNFTEEAVLLVNIKGCGYPPDVTCGNFSEAFGYEGASFPCYYSRVNRSVVLSHYARDDQVAVIVHYFAIPFVLTVVTAVILCVMHCRCEDDGTRRHHHHHHHHMGLPDNSDCSISTRVDMLAPSHADGPDGPEGAESTRPL